MFVMVLLVNRALLLASPSRPDPWVFTLITPALNRGNPTLSNWLLLMLGTRVALCCAVISRLLTPFEGAVRNLVLETFKTIFEVDPASSPAPTTIPLPNRFVYLLSNASPVLLS
jgi:hypothetical protein